jgi:hypothetical protein
MISEQELLHGKTMSELTQEQKDNFVILLERVNKVRTAWGKPMTITNTIRTMAEHLAIYAKKGITDKSKIPMRSNHLVGAATDVSDPNLELTQWLKDNPQVMEECDIFCELGNSNWSHIQIRPFASYKVGGTRWFKP